MKIFAIGRNYAEHIAELGNERPDEPVIFMKPETALVKNNQPFYYPEFSTNVHYEVEVVLKVCKEGKHIEPRFAHKYYDEIGLGVDFTARDLQDKLKAKGLPWEIAKGFNGSAHVSPFYPLANYANLADINFKLAVNDEVRQKGNTSHMLFNFNEIVSHISRYFTLKKGDIIYTGTPAGVGPVAVGDVLEGYLEDKQAFIFKVL